jgi:hypothetical protein
VLHHFGQTIRSTNTTLSKKHWQICHYFSDKWAIKEPSIKLHHYILLQDYQSLLPIGLKLQRYEMGQQGRGTIDSIQTSSMEKMCHPWHRVRETICILKEQEQNPGQVSNSHFCTLPCVITHFRNLVSFIIFPAMLPCPSVFGSYGPAYSTINPLYSLLLV